MIKIKKRVLENFIKNIVESRSDGHSYADVTGTMFDIVEDEPIKPSEMMSTQLAVEAPPVDDPDYVPATKGELGRAAQLISEEVPEDQIERVYRQLHKILDSALDKHEDDKLSESIYKNLKLILEAGPGDDEFGDEDDEAAKWLRQYGGDLDDASEDDVIEDFGGGSIEPTSMTMGDAIIQAKKMGDENIKQIEDYESLEKELRSQGVVPVKVNIAPAIERRLQHVSKAASLAYSGEDIPKELQTLVDAAKEWEFDHPDAPKYIDAVFLAMHAVYEVNYQLLVANHGLQFAGPEIKEKDTGFGKKLDIGMRKPGSVGSREHYAGIIEDIQEKYGLSYKNAIKIRSVFNMSDSELDNQIMAILAGLHQYNPIFKAAFEKYSSDTNQQGSKAMEALAKLLRMAYKHDVEKEEVLIDKFIEKFFSKIRVRDYYNLTKFTYHAWKDSESIIQDYPLQILDLIKRSKFYKGGVFKVTHPNIPEKYKEYTEPEMLEAIKVYVKGMVNASIDFHESQIEEKEAMSGDYEMSPEEVAKRETAKKIKTLEKQANPSSYTHIAPLYGFSGESGLRQWVLKFPERKLRMLSVGYGSESDNFPGLKKLAKIWDEIFDIAVMNIPLYLTMLTNDVELENFTKLFFNLKVPAGTPVGNVKDPQQMKDQMEDFKRIFLSAKNDFEMINQTIIDMDSYDIGIVQKALEEGEPVPFERLTPDILNYYEEDEIIDMVNAYTRGMSGVGGHMARQTLADVIDDIITNTDKPWMMAIAKELETRYEAIDAKMAKSLAEHFMGKKNPPDYDKPNKSGTKKFIDLGIGEKEFFELSAEAIVMYDDIISKYILKKEKDMKSMLASIKRADLSSLKRQNPNQQKATIKAAHEVYPPMIVLGIHSFDDALNREKQLQLKSQEAEEFKTQQTLQEIVKLHKVLERLI